MKPTINIDAFDLLAAPSVPATPAPSQTLTFDAGNRVVGYTYDVRGNVLSDGTYTYTWDAYNRLTGVKLATTGAVVAAYAYDANSMRQVATIGSTTTRYVVDSLTDEIVALTDAAGAVTKRFVRDAGGRLVAMISGGATYTYLTNAHGDVTALVNSAGAIVARWTYDAWGVPTEYNGTGGQVALGTAGNPFLFAGYYYDTATGHYYLRARYYDPRTGRFLSMDPEPGKTTDRLSQNPYIYCQNDPVNLIDPTGRRADAGGGSGRLTWRERLKLAALRAKGSKTSSGTARGGSGRSRRVTGGLASSVRKIGAMALLGTASPLSYPKFLESKAYQNALRYVADGAEGAKYGWEAGLTAHALITADYIAKNPGHDIYGNYFVRGAGRKGNFGYADIYDKTNHEVYEIKPESHHGPGWWKRDTAQLTGYITGIRLAGDPKAHAGTLYPGGIVKGFTATVYGDAPGMIYYSGAPKVPVTVPARQPSEQDSRERSTSLQFAYEPVYASSELLATVPAGGSPAWEACTTAGNPAAGRTFIVVAVLLAVALAAPSLLPLLISQAQKIGEFVGPYSYAPAY